MCAMAFELHSIVIHRLYSRSFVSLPRREERKALSLEKNEILYTCNLIKSTLALFRDQIYVNFINFSRFYIVRKSIRKQFLQRIVYRTLLLSKRTINNTSFESP